jgi:hypothetical protein
MENINALARDMVYNFIHHKYLRDVYFPEMEISLTYKRAFYNSLKVLGLSRGDAKILQKYVSSWYCHHKFGHIYENLLPDDFMPRDKFDEYLLGVIKSAQNRVVISG